MARPASPSAGLRRLTEEIAIGEALPDWTELADDTDWGAEWPADG
ncbi:MAG TPA: hypothetical protein VKI20_07155 [Acidimicrobiales bacterium]|nr:hypothetical protein [Acidimicrobiales bacterium]